MELEDYLIEELKTFYPSKNLALRALKSLPNIRKEQLFGENHRKKRIAEGMFYEALVYEILILIAGKTSLITGIVKKYGDIDYKKYKSYECKNGFSYQSLKNIVVIGDGQEIAEIDYILVDNLDRVIFIEATTSMQNLDKIEKEIDYKRQLFQELFNITEPKLYIISNENLLRNEHVKEVLQDPLNYFIQTRDYFDILYEINLNVIKRFKRKKHKSQLLVNPDEISNQLPFNYKRRHDKIRKEVLGLIKNQTSIKSIIEEIDLCTVVSKIIVGELYPNAVKSVLEVYKIKINTHDVNYDFYLDHFEKVIIAINIPDFRPVIYFKVREEKILGKNKKLYLKFGPYRKVEFRFERNIPEIGGFYNRLENVKDKIEKQFLKTIFHTLLRKDIYINNQKDRNPKMKI